MAKSKKSNSNIVNALMYIIIGVLFCVFRAGVINWLMTIAGVLFIVFGVIDITKGGITQGVLNIAIGVIILLGGWLFLEIVLIVFGVLIAVKGVLSLATALKRKKANAFEVLFAVLTIVAGIMLIISKWAIMDWFFIVMGVLFIVDGALALLGKK